MTEDYPHWIRVEAKHHNDMAHAIRTLNDESDRGAAIIGAAIMDLALTAALKEHLQKHEKIANAVFSITGPVGDFSAKIDLALLVGLVGNTMYRDLVTIKDIRNYFAHRINVSDFKSEAIRTLAGNLKLIETRLSEGDPNSSKWPDDYWLGVEGKAEVLADPRSRYLITLNVICYGLAIPQRMRTPEPEI
jgi:hypothetical protein